MVKSAKPLNILVTGAGAPGLPGTLYALRKNPDGRAVRIIGVDMDDDVSGCFLVDRFYKVPPPEDPSYSAAMLRICDDESVTVILPQTTREIAQLSCFKEKFERRAVHVMVSEARAIEAANNKWLLLQKARELGVPCPAAHWASREEELVTSALELGYPHRPVVVKPAVSNGMRGVRILSTDAWDVPRFLRDKPLGLEISLDELLAILRRGPGWPELIVMEYLPGAEYSVDAFIGEKLELALPRLREKIRTGITFRSRSDFREDLSRHTLELARHLGLRFAFGFQFKLDAHGTPKLLECNPRIQGTMVASVFSGANLIWFGVKELLGEPVEPKQVTLKPACFYRSWGGVGVSGEFTEAI